MGQGSKKPTLTSSWASCASIKMYHLRGFTPCIPTPIVAGADKNIIPTNWIGRKWQERNWTMARTTRKRSEFDPQPSPQQTAENLARGNPDHHRLTDLGN